MRIAALACALALAALAPYSSGLAAATGVTAAAGADTTILGHYLMGLTSLRADFRQQVSDAHGTVLDSGSGSLALLRPGRFRWDYRPAAQAAADRGGAAAGASDQQSGGELLVADGRNLWYYDRELAQVTVKPLQANQAAQPIMLLSGSSEQLDRDFEVTADGSQQGLSWVRVRPRSEQAGFTEARLGFKGDTLTRMVFHDMVGQTVQLDFSHSERNARIDPSAFEFKVPPGVDLIGKPMN